MRTVGYSMMVEADSKDYKKDIPRIANKYHITGPLLVFRVRSVILARFMDGSLETKIYKGRPVSQIPRIVTEYERLFGANGESRWVIVSPEVVEGVTDGLTRLPVFKGGRHFYIEVNQIYDSTPNPPELPTSNPRLIEKVEERTKVTGVPDRLDSLVSLANARMIEDQNRIRELSRRFPIQIQ